MKRSGPAMPPQPRSRVPKLPAETQTVIIGAFYGIVYSFDPENKWQTKIQDYIRINFVDKRNDVDCTYQILAADSQERELLNYTITSSTKSNVKGNFVKWDDEKLVHGARFAKPNIAQEFCDQLSALVKELVHAENAKKLKESSVTIDIILANGDSRQFTVDKNLTVDGLLDNVCGDENLNQSFYAINYNTIANNPVPISCKMADLECSHLKLVDKRDLKKSLSLDTKQIITERKNGRKPGAVSQRQGKSERSSSPSKADQDFVLNVSDQLVINFLDLANIHTYELKRPRVHAIVQEFIAEKGGTVYLKKIRDTKLSRSVLDEVGEIAQKVTALCESPTKTNHDFARVASVQEASTSADKGFDLRRAYSLGTVSPIHEMNKGKASNAIALKKKRKAPLPPGSHRQLVHASSMTSVNSKDEEDGFGMAVTEKKSVKEKRRAPLPPGVNPSAEASSSPTPSALSTGSSVESTIDSTPPSAPYTGTNALKSQETVTQFRRASSSSVSTGPLESDELVKSLEVRKSLKLDSSGERNPLENHATREDIGKSNSEVRERVSSNDVYRMMSTGKDKQKISTKPGKAKIKDSNMESKNSKAVGEIKTGVGYSVDLLENQMKTILHSLELLSDVQDEEQREVLVKPLLLQQTILQKMIDKEKESLDTKNVLGVYGGAVQNSVDNNNANKQRSTGQHVARYNSETFTEKPEKDSYQSFETDTTEAETDSVVEAVRNEHMNVDFEHSESHATNSLKINGNQIETQKAKSLKITDEFGNQGDKLFNKAMKGTEKEEIQKEKQKYEEQKMLVEAEKRKKELERQKEEEERKQIAEETKRVKLELERKQQEDQKHKKLLEEAERQRIEKEKHEELLRRQEELRKREETEMLRKMKEEKERLRIEIENGKKKEEEARKKFEEEKKKRLQEEKRRQLAEEEEKRMEEEKKRRVGEQHSERVEVEGRKIVEEGGKNKIMEEQKNSNDEEENWWIEEEERRRDEEQKQYEIDNLKKQQEFRELERLRKELEIQKEKENERLIRERQEIEDLKRQLKEQRELFEKGKTENETLKDENVQRIEKIPPKTKHENGDDKGHFLVIEKEINFEEGQSESPKAKVFEPPSVDVITNENTSKIEESVSFKTEEKPKKVLKIESSFNIDLEDEQQEETASVAQQSSITKTAVANSQANPKVLPKRPSANLVSSAIRTSDSDSTKKPLLGLYAKIQQIASERSGTVQAGSKNLKTSQPLKDDKVVESSDNTGKGISESRQILKSEVNQNNKNVTDQIFNEDHASQKEVAFVKDETLPSMKFQQVNSSDAHQMKENELTGKIFEIEKESSTIGDTGACVVVNKENEQAFPVSVIKQQGINELENVSKQQELDSSKKVQKQSNISAPYTFKPQVFRPTSSFKPKLAEKKSSPNIDSDVSVNQRIENVSVENKEVEVAAGVNEHSKEYSRLEVKTSKEESEPDLSAKAVDDQRKISQSETHINESKQGVKSIVGMSKKQDMNKGKHVYLPGVLDDTTRNSEDLVKNAFDADDINFSFQSGLGNYRPKCISPDDLRSASPPKSQTVGSNKSTSASILKSTVSRKVPPKTLPKTGPKTLPKQKSIGSNPVDDVRRESIKEKIQSFNQPNSNKGTDKKIEVLNLAAIPNRRFEISSGNISSSIMNKDIKHEDKKERSNSKGGDKARMLPVLPNDTLEPEKDTSPGNSNFSIQSEQAGSVASEPVQPPSLLRRISLNAALIDAAKPVTLSREPVSKETNPNTQDACYENSEEAEQKENADQNSNIEPLKLGNYASIREANKNENSDRDTVTVKKVGGLKIGFGRDKPKVYNV
ncbi:calponin homology domain-containing protein DDB_G0272472-like isoform X2 [Rhopilema esculentum]|uniref:calponin homology domain-containing protein DDB_G0272472-like isoform X2 n=1 Tax=Rhopilema esculentum TaxID=499914 RepID=UPI0031DC2A9F